jgi:ATP-binding cassette subfamily F protein uup
MLDREIRELAREKELINEKLNSGNAPYAELQQLAVRITEISAALDEKEMRWLELSELNE